MYFAIDTLAAGLLGTGARVFLAGKLQSAVFYDFEINRAANSASTTLAGSTATHALFVQRVESGACVSVVTSAGTYKFFVTVACLGRLLGSLKKSFSCVRVVFYTGTALPETGAP